MPTESASTEGPQTFQLLEQPPLERLPTPLKLSALCLQAAAALDYQDKTLLETAAQQCIQVLEQQPDSAPAHLQLGYILLLLGHRVRAQAHLQQAQQHSATRAEAMCLLAYRKKNQASLQVQPLNPVQRMQQAPQHLQLTSPATIAKIQTLPLTQAPEAEGDALYFDTENLIQCETHKAFQQAEKLSRFRLAEAIVLEGTRLQGVYRSLRHQLERLRQSFEIAELEAQFQPLQLMYRLLQDYLQLHQEPQSLGLQTWYARCDHYADQLDLLEAEGLDITAPDIYYQWLVEGTEALNPN